jgi:hypothetical protein
MKVRISGNKIRYRLKEPEVKQFQKEGTLSEVLEFGLQESEKLTFSLRISSNPVFAVQFVSNETIISVPQPQASEWTSTELVGFKAEIDTGKGKIISILVEKDFMCMDGREEDNIGSFPNPLAT